MLKPFNSARLKTEVRLMMMMCFWKNSHHWSSEPTHHKKNDRCATVRVAYFKNLDWFGFNFRKFHPDAVEFFRQLPPHDRFFHTIAINRYTKFSVWCISGQHFPNAHATLGEYADIKLEFTHAHQKNGLVIPEPFSQLGLKFYERGG